MGGIILQTLPLSSTNLSRQTVLCKKKTTSIMPQATSLHDQKRESGSKLKIHILIQREITLALT